MTSRARLVRAIIFFTATAVVAGLVLVVTGRVGRRSGPHAESGEGAAKPGHVVGGVGTSAAPTAAWVIAENAKPGTRDWQLAPHQHQGAIEGFANRVSVQPGEPVELAVSTSAATFHVEAYRMGFYGGLGGRLVWQSADLPGARRPAPTIAPGTNTVETNWQPSLTVDTGSWPPGDYLFKLVGASGEQQYVPLTLRDDQSHSAYLLKNSVATWQAYNLWGGYDLYEGKSGRNGSSFGHRSRIVSFDRPYRIGDGSGDFLGSEYPLVSLMESRGFDVSYTTDVDVHEHPELLEQHRSVLSLGHDEYWSTAMRDGVEAARNQGVNIAFFGANALFRHIRFAPSPTGDDRRIVDYKSAREDPETAKDKREATVNWRDPPLNRPESSLIGDYYECNPVKADMVVVDSGNWMFEGTGVHDGDKLTNVVGSEYDRYTAGVPVPSPLEILTHSPLRCHGRRSFSDSTYYTAPSGAGVFATGTNGWIANLDQTCSDCPGPTLIRITENVLAAFGAGPAARQHPAVSNIAQVVRGGAATASSVEDSPAGTPDSTVDTGGRGPGASHSTTTSALPTHRNTTTTTTTPRRPTSRR